MKYSQATDYALHAMLYLVMSDSDKPIGVQMLAAKLNVSRTYLSKMMAQLVKAGLIQSVSGVNGGYRLRQRGEDISFLDVIQAIEGTASLFECSLDHGTKCLIQQVVFDAERQMEDYLRHKKIADLIKLAKTE
ncbi:HTH-type transcriptional repressor NsrR [Paenibacillus polymyxa E681]|uniref:RrF2 family transcriptional regulator n=1 Tax=Paenibacillus polymyxa TaxID=1406 RepID=UPI0001E32253|nr:Rrf2 family transcriptional regulator [Paenibacillus polymyxa]ADM72653.1 Rrf2 family transcriptional regulator [Paenibacillus polymyxa E681]QNV59680.1 HTH-type transcriptional repressor NsrR [Paenibacillus polymyxa E681]QNV64506.1 HTH-type transcriptional repressor NsrR [Paenibacillus polymyxa E681]